MSLKRVDGSMDASLHLLCDLKTDMALVTQDGWRVAAVFVQARMSFSGAIEARPIRLNSPFNRPSASLTSFRVGRSG
jgi:hypothetical protein